MMNTFEIKEAKNPRWDNAEKTFIICDVWFAGFDEFLSFGACLSDPEPHGRELFTRAAAGEFGPVADYVPAMPIIDQGTTKA